MKTLIILILMTFQLNAEETIPTELTTKDIMQVNLVVMEVAETKLNELNTLKPCPQNPSQTNVTVPSKKIGEQANVECNCKLDQENGSLFFSLVGNNVTHEMGFIDGNDNFLNGLLAYGPEKYKKYNGDDLGRTFQIGSSYQIKGDSGELKLTLDSTGFGKYVKQKGSWYDKDYHHYLVFRELDTVDLTFKKDESRSDNAKNYSIYEIKYEGQTDSGNVAREIQDKWHHSININGKTPRIYHYLNEAPDSHEVTAFYGLGTELSKKMAGLKCDAKVEGKVGASTGSEGTYLAMGARGEIKITPQVMPYLVMSLWGEMNRDYKGNSRDSGVEFSFPIKGRELVVTPFIGFEKHYSKMDTSFATDPSRANEVFSTFGFNVKWK